MKINVNYDLVDKAKEAKTGFSLNRYCKKVGFCTGFVGCIKGLEAATGATPPDVALLTTSALFLSYLAFFRISAMNFSEVYKNVSVRELNNLSSRLKDIFVDTDAELLMETTSLKTDYEVVLNDSSIPVLKQKNYYLFQFIVIGIIILESWFKNILLELENMFYLILNQSKKRYTV